MNTSITNLSGLPSDYIELAPVDEIRAESQWAAKALINSEVERTGKVMDGRERSLIEKDTAQFLEKTSLETGLDLAPINEQIFKARTGRGLMDEVIDKLALNDLRLRVDQSIANAGREKLLGLQQAQQAFSRDEYIDHEAAYIADLMLEKKGVVLEQLDASDALKGSLVAAAKYADLNLPELAEKLELGKAMDENKQLKSQELESYGELRGVPKKEHLNDLIDYQVSYDQKLGHASYIAYSMVEKDSPELSGASRSDAEASLTNKLIRADIKGEIALETMKADISLKNAELSDEIHF